MFDEEDYYNKIHALGQTVSDYGISSLSLKRQTQLLAISLLMLLINNSVIEFTNGTSLGVKYNLLDKDTFRFGIVFVCTYFLLSFCLSVVHDIQKQKYIMRKSLYEIRNLLNNLYVDSLNKMNKAKEIQASCKSSDIDELYKEEQEIWEKYQSQIDDLSIEYEKNEKDLKYSECMRLTRKMIAIGKLRDMKIAPYYEMFEEFHKEVNKKLDKSIELQSSAFDQTYEKRQKRIKSIATQDLLFSKLRFYLDIAMPIIISVVAIITSVFSA